MREDRAVRVLGQPVPWPIAATVPLLFIVLGVVYYWLSEDKWATFQSSQYHFSIEYPTSWTVGAYGERGSRGQDYLRAQFIHPLSPINVQIHTKSMKNPSLSDAVEWGEAIILRDRGIDISGPRSANIGIEEYPALVRTYRVPTVNHDVTVYYVVTGDQALALEFSVRAHRYSEAGEISGHMLSSFDLQE